MTAPAPIPGGCTTPDPFIVARGWHVRQRRLAAAFFGTGTRASTGAGADRLHDARSVRVSRGWYVRQRRLAAADHDDADTSTRTGTGTRTGADGLHDARSVRRSRGWYVRQRRLAAADHDEPSTSPAPAPAAAPRRSRVSRRLGAATSDPYAPAPAPGAGPPTTSTITQLSGPTSSEDGQVWTFQSVESPNWDKTRWGTDTHKFNVVVKPGSGQLAVTLVLHGHQNGTREPGTYVNSNLPGIYVHPVDLAYEDGQIDPITGKGRSASRWMGHTDASGVFQPVTADRVVRYIQWVLQQTQRWNPDPSRVYVLGGSMGGGGAMHLAALFPHVFAAGVSSTGWIDLNAWLPASSDCQAGVRWRTTSGPLCTQMFDQVYLTQNTGGDLPPLMLTWNSNDGTVKATRYPELMAMLETKRQGYVAEWKFNPDNDHQFFLMPSEPHLRYRLNAPYVAFSGGGSATSASAGTRQTDRAWSNLTESSTQLTVTLTGSDTSSITIRRRQSFRPAAGASVSWTAGTATGTATVASDGSITIPGVALSTSGIMLRLTSGS